MCFYYLKLLYFLLILLLLFINLPLALEMIDELPCPLQTVFQ